MGGGTTLSLINFTLSLYLFYLSYRLYEFRKERAYVSLALVSAAVYIYLEFVAFRIPVYYPFIFRLESAMYILSSYFFYRSFCVLYRKFNYISLALLISMLLYITFAPLISYVEIYKFYFVEYYVHGWGEFVVAFFYFYILLFVIEGRKIVSRLDGELKIRTKKYVSLVILTITGAAVSRYLGLVLYLPHFDSVILSIGYTYLYILFNKR